MIRETFDKQTNKIVVTFKNVQNYLFRRYWVVWTDLSVQLIKLSWTDWKNLDPI